MEEDALGTRAGSERWSVGEKGSEQLQRYRERRDGDLAWSIRVVSSVYLRLLILQQS